MIRSLYTLGRSIAEMLANNPDTIVEQLALPPEDDKSFIGVFDVSPSTRTLRHHVEEASTANLRRLLWLQLMKFSPGGDVRDVTVRDLKYLLGPVFVGLVPWLLLQTKQPPKLDELEPIIQPIIPILRDFGATISARNRFLLDLNGFRLEPAPDAPIQKRFLEVRQGILHIKWNELEQIEAKQRADELAKELRDALGWKREVRYFTLSIEGRRIAEESAYRRYVLSIVLDEPFQEGEVTEGRCHLCGQTGRVTKNFVPMRLKIFINDKVSFAGNIQKGGFFERYTICQRCYMYVLIADRLLEQELEVSLLQTPVFLIPELVQLPATRLEGVRQALQGIRQEATELGRVTKLRQTVADLARAGQERAARYAALTLLFHEKQNMSVKVREVVAEVPPSRVQRVIVAINRVNDAAEPGGWAEPFVGRADRVWFYGLDDLLNTLPLRRSEGRPVIRPALTLARQLIQQEPIDLTALHAAFLEGARAIRSAHTGYWIVPQQWADRSPSPEEVDRTMRAYLARTLALRLLAQEVGCTSFGGAAVSLLVPDPYRTAMQELHLEEQEQSLFLLGVLLARVASEQYRSDQSKTKPVLEKLNYTGMSLPRVTVFANELFDKLRQYRLLSGDYAAENELLFAEAVQRLTRYRAHWSLTDAENVYFLLSGYAYETGRIIQRGRDKSSVGQQEAQ